MDKDNLHFFLGGNDLEMVTIKKLLDKEGAAYSDAGLSWGASTSKYGDEIEKVAKEGKTPVIIELGIDSKLPENTINVDHHNENADKPASILQVCELLGVEPTREMQLVAANEDYSEATIKENLIEMKQAEIDGKKAVIEALEIEMNQAKARLDAAIAEYSEEPAA